MGCQPRYIPDELMDDLAHCCHDFHINTPLRLAFFLGQCGEESGGLRYPLEIASGSAYEWRSDLGNNHAGDGVKFAGTGWIQVTGRHNHQKFSDYLAGIGKADPKIMEVGKTYTCNRYPWSISGYWWLSNGMNELCDKRPDVDRVGQRVNGVYPPETYRDGDSRVYIAYSNGSSRMFCDVPTLRKWLKLPKGIPSRDSFDSWIASIEAADQERASKKAQPLTGEPLMEGKAPNLSQELLATGFGPEAHEEEDPVANTRMVT